MDETTPNPTTSVTAVPRPVPSIIEPPPASGLQTAGAVIAILFCLAAAVIGYKILRGGRGL